MPRAHIIRRIRNRPEELFELVSNVETYPDFISLISALRITKKLSDTEFEAEAVVAYKMLSETFRSHVIADPEALRIEVTKAEKGGAVKSLFNSWNFHRLEDGSTLIDVVVDVKLKAKALEFVLRDKFQNASVQIVKSFETHAFKSLRHIGAPEYDFTSELKALGLDSEKVI